MKSLKIIVFSIILFHSLGIFPNSIIFNNIYTARGNLAFAQEEQKKDSKTDKSKKEKGAEGTQNKKDKEGEQKKETTEKETEKIKLPKQNNIINPETFRMMEKIEKKNKKLKNRKKEKT